MHSKQKFFIFVASIIGLVGAAVGLPVADAQEPDAQGVVAPVGCSFVLDGGVATVTVSPAVDDGAQRYVFQTREDGQRWLYAHHREVGTSLTFRPRVVSPTAEIGVIARVVGGEISDRAICTEQSADGFQLEALWTFDDGDGTDSIGGFNAAPVEPFFAGGVVYANEAAIFDGSRNSILTVDVSGDPESFSAAAGDLRWEVEFSMTASQMESLLAFPDNETWNVMQRGLFNNPGGQWKVQIAQNNNGQLFPECTAKRGTHTAGDRLTSARSTEPIVAGVVQRLVCTFDASTNTLTATYGASIVSELVDDSGTGAVAPAGAAKCSEDGATQLGDVVTIGNKPECTNEAPDGSDAFQGTIYEASVSTR